MSYKPAAAVALALWLVSPVSAAAQFRLSDITPRDVATVVDLAIRINERSARNRRSSGRTVSLPRPDTRGGGTSGKGSTTTVARGGAGSSRAGARVISKGEEYLGVPYLWGGSTPDGFDCSGFVQYVYRDNGVSLPRTSRQMAHAGVGLPNEVGALRQGDLMLFANSGKAISHVAIYAGNNRIIHSSSSGNGVRYDDLGSSRGRWYATHLVAARRVTDVESGRSLVSAVALSLVPFDFFDPPDKAPRIRR